MKKNLLSLTTALGNTRIALPQFVTSSALPQYAALAILFILFNIHTVAQPVKKWDKAYGGSLNDNYACFVYTRDGGAIIGGTSFSNVSGEKTEASRGSSDFWLLKTDKFGNVEFDKTIGGSSTDALVAIAQTPDGGFILGGSSSSPPSGEKTAAILGYDFWLVKLDATGDIEWDKTYGDPDDDGYTGDYCYLHSLQVTDDGGYIMSGRVLMTSNEGYNIPVWVIKTDNNGNITWENTIGGEHTNQSVVKQHPDGGYFVGSTTYSHISERYRYDITKLDANGILIWRLGYGGLPSNFCLFYDLLITPDGGCLAGGISADDQGGDKSENSRGGGDYWVIKLSTTGTKMWDKTIGGSNEDWLRKLKINNDGYLLGGYSYSNVSGEKTENNKGKSDYWVVKLDTTGTAVLWDKTVGGAEDDFLNDIRVVSNNRYILAGTSLSGISNDKTVPSRGGEDYWLVSVNYIPPSSAHAIVENKQSVFPESKNSFLVYPNPAINILNIELTGKAVFNLSNQFGKTFITKSIDIRGSMDIRNVPPGMYFLTNTTTGTKQTVVINK